MVIRKRKRNNMSIYKRWKAMKQRCLRTSHVSYKYYGGRGITVCDRWMDFELFYEDMGDPPKGKTLERINTNGNYEPGNCKWATPGEQAQNKRLRISSIRAIKKRKAKLIIMLKRNYNYYKEAGILEDLYLTEDEMRKIKLEASIAVSIIKEL